MTGTRAMLVMTLAACTAHAFAQVPPAPPPPGSESALKLPDGTVVVFTRSPEDLRPTPEGVLLPAAEFRAIQEQLAKARADRPAPVAPSACDVRGQVSAEGDRLRAALTLTYTVRTTSPHQAVVLGTAGALPAGARLADGRLPLLLATEAGLTATLETPGDHTLSVDVVAAVGPRGPKGEPGFTLGLPKAAITTLSVELPAGVKLAQLGLPTAPTEAGERWGETRWTAEEATRLRAGADGRGYPLGPVAGVELSWEPPAKENAPSAQTVRSAEIDLTVRVGEAQIETTARLKLRGGAEQWLLALPAAADIVSERLADGAAAVPEGPMNTAPGLTRPTGPDQPFWAFRPPNPQADWLVTAVFRQPRVQPPAGGAAVPHAIGPVAVPTALRVSGVARVVAPPTVRATLGKASVELRRVEPTAAAEAGGADWRERPASEYRFAAAQPVVANADPVPFCELTLTPFPGFQRVEPAYELRRVGDGWRLAVEARVTPVREEAGEVLVAVPPGWQGVAAAAGGELVERTDPAGDAPAGRLVAVRLAAPQSTPFTLTLTATRGGPAPGRDEFALPTFPSARASSARVAVAVPEGYEVAATAWADDGTSVPLAPPPAAAAGGPTRAVSGRADRGVAGVEVAWREYRPELSVESRAEVTLDERQAVVTQTLRFRRVPGDVRPVLLAGPAIDLRVLPPTPGDLETVDPETWRLRLPDDGPREFAVAVRYALPLAGSDGGTGAVPLPLLTARNASRLDAHVRLWGGSSSRRVTGFSGPWRELPPEPAADRPALPWLTLSGAGSVLPLAVTFADGEGVLPGATVERAAVQTQVHGDGSQSVRGRFRLRRWAGGSVDLEVPDGPPPEVLADGLRIDPATFAPLPAGLTGMKAYRVPLPEPRGLADGLLLEVGVETPGGRPPRGRLTLHAPRLPEAVYSDPVRVAWELPPDTIALVADADLRVEQVWEFRGGLLSPVTPPAAAGGWPSGNGGASLAAWQARPGPVTVVLVPRAVWVACCSLAVVALGLISYPLRPAVLGLGLTAVGIAAAAGAAFYPQPASQVLYGMQPGLAAVAVGYAAVAVVGWYYRRRVTHLPGFTRNPAALSTTSLTNERHQPAAQNAGRPGSSRGSDLTLAGSTPARRVGYPE